MSSTTRIQVCPQVKKLRLAHQSRLSMVKGKFLTVDTSLELLIRNVRGKQSQSGSSPKMSIMMPSYKKRTNTQKIMKNSTAESSIFSRFRILKTNSSFCKKFMVLGAMLSKFKTWLLNLISNLIKIINSWLLSTWMKLKVSFWKQELLIRIGTTIVRCNN